MVSLSLASLASTTLRNRPLVLAHSRLVQGKNIPGESTDVRS